MNIRWFSAKPASQKSTVSFKIVGVTVADRIIIWSLHPCLPSKLLCEDFCCTEFMHRERTIWCRSVGVSNCSQIRAIYICCHVLLVWRMHHQVFCILLYKLGFKVNEALSYRLTQITEKYILTFNVPLCGLNVRQTERDLSLAQHSLGWLQTFPEAVTDKCQRVVGKLLGEWSLAAVLQAAKNPFIILAFSCPKFYPCLLSLALKALPAHTLKMEKVRPLTLHLHRVRVLTVQ